MGGFNVMIRTEYFFLGLRDRFGIPFKPEKEIKKLNLEKGQIVLDYGCGIGSYTFPAAKLVGKTGKVYALDKQPLAIRKVKKRAQKEGIYNIETILSDKKTELLDKSVDIVLLYGVLPEIEDKKSLLKELYRVLKPGGCLSTRYCFKIKKEKVIEIVKAIKLFSLIEEKDQILNFKKEG